MYRFCRRDDPAACPEAWHGVYALSGRADHTVLARHAGRAVTACHAVVGGCGAAWSSVECLAVQSPRTEGAQIHRTRNLLTRAQELSTSQGMFIEVI